MSEIENTTGIDEAQKEVSFAELLEQSDTHSERLRPGQKIKAKVIAIAGELVYIDLGGKTEAVIAAKEFADENGNCTAKLGDEVEAFFVTVEDGFKKLTTLLSGYPVGRIDALKGAYDAGVAVNGEVKSEVKGGFEVSVGGIKCFCPQSQIDLRGVKNGGGYTGNTFAFKVLECDDRGRNVVLSRRALLEEENKSKFDRLKETLTVGKEVSGKVRSLQNFGAFVDIGGIDGLIPISEMSWGRIENPASVLTQGQDVKVKVIGIDWDKRRVSLSIKALSADPWMGAEERYQPGSRIKGRIARLLPFGVFVTLEDGIDGLIHISNLGAGRRIKHPRDVVEVGQEVEGYIVAVDIANRKISVSLQPESKPKQIDYPKVGDMVEGTVEKVLNFGIFVKLNEDLTALIPNSEAGTPRGSDHTKMFPAGGKVQAAVIDVDAENGKVTLSLKAVKSREEQDEYKTYMESMKKNEKGEPELSVLGEKLKSVIENKNS